MTSAVSLTCIELSVGGNEASDLLAVRSPELLASRGWRHGLWTVLDEAPVEECVALLGVGDDGRWETHVLHADAGADSGRTEDAESLAYRDGHIYIVGSHFGAKKGPLQPRRAFIARFAEDAACAADPVRLQVSRNRFGLHRAINDAIAASGLDLLNSGALVHERFVVNTRDRGVARGKSWVERIVTGDVPVNIEGAAFTEAGTLLLGLRFPVTVKGAPLIVELVNVDDVFEGAMPVIGGVYMLDVVEEGSLLGIRALSARADGSFDVIVGSIDAIGKGSVLLEDHPTGGDVACRHVRFWLPADGGGSIGPLATETVSVLAGWRNVEGVAELDNHAVYVTDDDHRVALWV